MDELHCISCSDEAIRGRVVELLPRGMATVDFGSVTEEVSVELVEAAPGDLVLVHAKVAIARLGERI
jgi:hydrogenase maturation factor